MHGIGILAASPPERQLLRFRLDFFRLLDFFRVLFFLVLVFFRLLLFFRVLDFFRLDFFRGTLAPLARASERPMAIACSRLFTLG
jgi:hypothetical protein